MAGVGVLYRRVIILQNCDNFTLQIVVKGPLKIALVSNRIDANNEKCEANADPCSRTFQNNNNVSKHGDDNNVEYETKEKQNMFRYTNLIHEI